MHGWLRRPHSCWGPTTSENSQLSAWRLCDTECKELSAANHKPHWNHAQIWEWGQSGQDQWPLYPTQQSPTTAVYGSILPGKSAWRKRIRAGVYSEPPTEVHVQREYVQAVRIRCLAATGTAPANHSPQEQVISVQDRIRLWLQYRRWESRLGGSMARLPWEADHLGTHPQHHKFQWKQLRNRIRCCGQSGGTLKPDPTVNNPSTHHLRIGNCWRGILRPDGAQWWLEWRICAVKVFWGRDFRVRDFRVRVVTYYRQEFGFGRSWM